MLRKEGGKGGLKEERARAVVRDVWQRGHHSVELRHDGRRAIFFCTICETRCYSDAALSDHLHGNLHARNSAAAGSWNSLTDCHFSDADHLSSKSSASWALERPKEEEEEASPLRNTHQYPLPMVSEGPPAPFMWLGHGKLFVRSRFSHLSKQIQASWLHWCGKNATVDVDSSVTAGESEYAIVVFTYSDGLGRSINDKDPLCTTHLNGENRVTGAKNRSSGSSKEFQGSIALQMMMMRGSCVADGKELMRMCGSLRRWSHNKNLLKSVERLCFICRQKMSAGKDVAALLNAKTGQIVCGSRNWRGAFHVFHTHCLIDWVALFNSKSFCGHLLGSSRKVRRRLRDSKKQVSTNWTIREPENATTNRCSSECLIFCPECQGTGVRESGVQLERPRYRLSQVFDWILELVVARKAWIDHPEEQMGSISGLLFSVDEDPEASKICATECQGLVKCYVSGCSEQWALHALDKKDDKMELDP